MTTNDSAETTNDDDSDTPAKRDEPADNTSSDDEPTGDTASDDSDTPADAAPGPDDSTPAAADDASPDEPTNDDDTDTPAKRDEPADNTSSDDEPTGDTASDDSDTPADAAPGPDDSTPAAADDASPDEPTNDDDTDTPAKRDEPADAAPGPDDSTAVAAGDASTDDLSSAELADEIVRLRAETAALQKQLDESMKPEPTKTKKRSRHSGRWWGSTVCLVLGAILLPISVIGRWTSTTVLDTETYVATVAPLAENEDIQEAVAFRVSELVVEVIDIEALVRDDLPRGTRFLAGPIEAASRTLIDRVVEEFVSSDAFARFWADANRLGHESVVAVFTGDSTDNIDAADGRVVLNVGPLAQGVIENLDEILGLDLANSIPEERLDGEFVIVDSDDLASVQGTIKLFDQLSVIIPILTIALFAASIYLSRPRRVGWLKVGYAIVIPMALCVLLYTWVRGQYTDGLPDDIHNPDAAAAFFDVTTRFLTRDLWVVLVVGVIILFVAWLIGPTGWAGRARAWWKELISKAGDKSTESEVGEFPRWVARYERGLLWTTFVLGAATLLLWTLPTATVVLLITVIVAVVMLGIHVLAEVGRKADADIEAERDADAEAAEAEAAHADAARLEEQSSAASR